MWNLLALVLGTTISAVLTYAIYNVYFHPLSKYPGPLLWRAFYIQKTLSAVRGRLPYDVLDLHRKYGSVVRISPNDLAFAEPQAWPDIYGVQPGRVQNRKDHLAYPPHDDSESDHHIIFGGDVPHARIRRVLGPGFTLAAARELGGMIEGYGDLLVKRLREVADGKNVQDVSVWFEWATFDIMGEFAFGESFGCLETATSHLFVKVLFDSVDISAALGYLERYKLWTIMQKILPKSAFKMMYELENVTKAVCKKRQERGHIPGHADMFNYLLQNKGDEQLSQKELEGNALTMLFAGADTTATLMIFGSYLLCRNPEVTQRARKEVRDAFRHDGEINAASVNELPYMIAMLTEVMRLYPPGPNGLGRHIVNEAGQMVAGYHVPHNTVCAVYQLAANRCDFNFARPEEFLPERWLADAPAEFANDRRDIYQPFSAGPRNCIGKPIAYIEMRVLMAKYLYNFTFELANPEYDWVSTKKAYGAWNNSGLKLRLSAIEK